MPRSLLLKGRASLPNHVYHVTINTAQKQKLFSDFYVGRLLIKEMSSSLAKHGVCSLAFVVMPDHLHWLIQLGEGSCLSGFIKSFKGKSAYVINRTLNRDGALWQKGFYDHAVRVEEDLRSIGRYIVANPLRANLVNRVEDYPLWDAIWIEQPP